MHIYLSITHISEYHIHTHIYVYITLKEIRDKYMKKKEETPMKTQGSI